ncbi:MAG: uroporphyrinogen decarboxylase family protein [Bacteroidales bacterium]
MTSKERLLASLSHKQPDKVPVDFGSTGVTGIHVQSIENLRIYYGLEYRPVKVTRPYQMLGEIDDDLLDIMGVDVRGLKSAKNEYGIENTDWKEFKTFWGQVVLLPGGFNTTTDNNGDLLIYPQGDTSAPPSGRMPVSGYFFDTIIRQPPIDESKLDPDDNLEEYGFVTDESLEYWKVNLAKAGESGQGIIASFGGTALGDIAHIPAPALKNPRGIRDIEEWYMSLLMRPDYIHQVFEKQTERALHNLSRFAGIAGNIVDVAYICGTDFGTQNSLFCAPETFDDLYKPYYRKINDWIHTNTKWKTFKHSCGAIFELIPNLIDSGFDILNPVQISATGMDPAKLKETYGKDIVFWGGGVDTQHVLSFGKPEEVRDQVLRQCDILGRDGGFVFSTVHNVQANVPVENLVAMLDAISEFGGQ